MNIPKPIIYTGAALLAAGIGYTGYKLYKRAEMRREIDKYSSGIDPNTGKKSSAPGFISALAVADTLAIDLGTAFNSLDPRSWTENDQEVFETLAALPAASFPAVEREYNQKYGRNLRMDIKKNLDRSLLKQITYIT